jgi:hypothetical protein
MTASSISWPSASRNKARVAVRGDGTLPASEVSAAAACDPDTRTMAIALGARPDDSAKMVCSRGCIAYLPATLATGKAIPPDHRVDSMLQQESCNKGMLHRSK